MLLAGATGVSDMLSRPCEVLLRLSNDTGLSRFNLVFGCRTVAGPRSVIPCADLDDAGEASTAAKFVDDAVF